MRNQIESRLQELQTEYQKGQQQLAALEQETVGVRDSMLRINGAIQVLKELLQEQEPNQIEGENNNPQSVGVAK